LRVNHNTIKNYFDEKGLVTKETIEANDELKKEYEIEATSVIKQIKDLNRRAWKMLDSLDAVEEEDGKPDYKQKVNVMHLVLKILDKTSNILSMLNPTPAKTEGSKSVNFIDLALQVNKQINELSDKQYIHVDEATGKVTKYKDLPKKKKNKDEEELEEEEILYYENP